MIIPPIDEEALRDNLAHLLDDDEDARYDVLCR